MLKVRWTPRVLLIAASLIICSAAAPPQTPQELAAQLSSTDTATVATAMTAVRQWIDAEPAAGMSYTRSLWLKPLVEGRHFADAEDLCVRAIAAWPMDVSNVEALQRERVQMLLDQHHNAEALAQAHALFNVSSMAATESSLLLVAECLNAVHENDSAVIDRFITQQRAGAAGTLQSPVTSPLMLGLKLDPDAVRPWDAAIAALLPPTGGLPASTPDLMAVGNLELLADRPALARAAFLRMQSNAEVEYLRAANEAVARAIKAEDGAIGRANAYADSLRPK